MSQMLYSTGEYPSGENLTGKEGNVALAACGKLKGGLRSSFRIQGKCL